MSLIENERTKLLANALDRASTGCMTVGVFTPLAGYIYNFGNIRETFDVWNAIAFFYWIAASVTLHLISRNVLKGLRS